jgi:dTDP-4-amino-4,6-dideoxygalactose transaminase
MILMNDFKSEPEKMREAMVAASRRVFESGWYVLGSEVDTFEKKWAAICGVDHGIGVGNGMDAIEISLRSLNIGPGDEVITTPMTAFASVLAILRAGAKPVLADIDPDTALLSIDSARRCLTPKTKAVLLVHLYGHLRNIGNWVTLCNEHNIHLIEDCAQAHLATSNGKVAGSFGTMGAYSFYPTKNLGAIGDAGMIVTANIELAEKAKRIRNYGQSVRYEHPEIGMNSRMDELQAALLSERLKWLHEFTKRRQQIAKLYISGINNKQIKMLAQPEESAAHVYHLFVMTCENRVGLQDHLRNCGIQALIHYPIPVHFQEPCVQIARDPKGLENSEKHANNCISIPCHPQMTDHEVQQVVSSVNSFNESVT